MPPTDAILQASNIGRINHREEGWLLRAISLSITAGDRVSVLGPSGSGKTLLLRALALLDSVDEGEIRFHGQTIHGDEVPQFRRQVMYLTQRPVLMEGSVEDNLRAPLGFAVYQDCRFDREAIVEMLGRLGRGESFLSQKQRNLSGGEMQIVALLRAMQLDPQVLLLDEPTAAIDAAAREEIEQFLLAWLQRSSQRAFLLVTHDADQAKRMANRTLRLDAGRLEGED